MANSAFKRVSTDLVLWLAASDSPTAEEWNDYLQILKAMSGGLPSTQRLRGLVISDGGAPSATQRKSSMLAIANHSSRWAVVTSSMIARSTVTVYRWLGLDQRAFGPQEVERAFSFLDVSPAEAREICSEFARLQQQSLEGTTVRSLGEMLRSFDPQPLELA
jgi:hypothetical protein